MDDFRFVLACKQAMITGKSDHRTIVRAKFNAGIGYTPAEFATGLRQGVA
jgi:hypothetical protein